LLVLAVGLVMAWEWSHVVRGAGADLAFGVHAASTAAATLLAAFGFAALGLAAVLAGALIVFTLQLGDKPLISAAGAVYTGVPAIALLWLRSDAVWGFWAVLFIFAVVVATDVAAFFCGRTLGGAKLAPSISPNKTWSGLIGGVAAAAAAAAAFTVPTGSDWTALAAIGAVLGTVSQMGDLAESALKRSFGVKDASNLIPGHGGFMDRADGIVAAAVAAAVFALIMNPHAPGQALVIHP
jgi:phosphatidate cytidylyltransferase